MVIRQIIKIKGFTLLEMAITIGLIAIIASIVGLFISSPIKAFSSVASRAELVDIAEMSLRRMDRDIHNSLPNSIRVKQSGTISALEIVNVVEGMRYRKSAPGTASDILDFGKADTSFNVLGLFDSSNLGSLGYRAVIYNTGANGINSDSPIAGANVYSTQLAPGPELPLGTHVITPSSSTVTLSNIGSEGRIVINPGFQFALESPQQRVYIIDSPISYICDTSTGNITRYYNYSINSVQPISNLISPLSSAIGDLVVNNVSSCSFTYQPGTSQRAGVVTIDMTVTKNSENVRLLQQVGVPNVP